MTSPVRRVLDRLPRPEDFASAVHDERVVARVGVVLGAAVVILFVTGLISHLHQNPVAWLPAGPEPVWAYRVSQGLHVAAGFACVPLLLAKLYAVYPRLFARPPVTGWRHALERASVGLLVAATTFQIVTGVLNVFELYVFGFGFTRVHYATGWLVLGTVLVHVGVQLPVIVRALAASPRLTLSQAGTPAAAARLSEGTLGGDRPGVGHDDAAEALATRRGFLGAVAVATLSLTALTLGQTWRPLRPVALLAPRDPEAGPQGLAVNKTARAAGVVDVARDPAWALEVVGPGGTARLGRDELLALEQHEAVLPIACVEGWSATARWGGVRIRDLVVLAGGRPDDPVHVESLQAAGSYRESDLPGAYVAHDDTLLALTLDGADLALDHGFPARIIAPNRPGVLQTKWVARLVVGGEA